MKIKYLIYTVILVFACSSCEDLLDKQPMDTLSPNNFWATPENALEGLVGCYDALAQSGREGFPVWDLWGSRDLLTPVGMSRNADFNVIAEGTADPTSTLFQQCWSELYKGVVRCNDLLDNIHSVDFSGDSLMQNQIIGEALFLRALYYYALVDYYGDVPLILKIQSVEESLVSRDPKATVVSRMMQDLDFAINNLPDSYTGGNIGRATTGAALALDVKYKMLIKDWVGAASSAAKILDLNYRLQAHFPDIFKLENENNSEVIFDIQFVDGALGEGNTFDKFYNNRSTQTNGWSRFNPSTYLVDMYEVIDQNPAYSAKT